MVKFIDRRRSYLENEVLVRCDCGCGILSFAMFHNEFGEIYLQHYGEERLKVNDHYMVMRSEDFAAIMCAIKQHKDLHGMLQAHKDLQTDKVLTINRDEFGISFTMYKNVKHAQKKKKALWEVIIATKDIDTWVEAINNIIIKSLEDYVNDGSKK